MIVVDTNVVAYYCMDGPRTAAAFELRAVEPEWHAPTLWHSEFCNILVGKLRRGDLDETDAAEMLMAAEALLANHVHAVSGADLFRLATLSRCSSYDLEFVALAQQLGVPLFTQDSQILQEFPGLAHPLS